jgi:hypothetical protein
MGESGSAISVVAVDGLVTLPEIRTSDLTLIQRDGLWAGDDYLNGRTVTLTLEVYGRSDEEFTAALSAVQTAFRPGRPEMPFLFNFPGLAGNLTGKVMARPRKRSGPLDLNFAYRVCNIVVELYCTDPYIYGAVARTVQIAGSSDPADLAVFSEYGGQPALPSIAFTGGENPVLTDAATGEFFGVLYVGDFTADSAAQKVTAADGEDITGLITAGSTWPEFPNGDHSVHLSSGTAVMTWVDRWV